VGLQLAEHYGIGAELWSATSYQQLRMEALEVERWLAADCAPELDEHVLGPACRWFSQPKIELPAKGLPHVQPPDISRRKRSRPLARHLHFRDGVGRLPPLDKPTRKVGPLAYSGRAVALPLTRTPMAGCSCRVGGPTFFLFTGLKSRGKAIFPDDP
jgi:hypothetical protein